MSGDANGPRLVRDLMTVGVPTCPPTTSVPDIARKLLEDDLEGIVVLDIEGHAVGVVTRKEIIEAYARGDAHSRTAEDIMHPGLPQIPPDIPLSAAAHLMLDSGVRVMYLTHHAGGIEYPAGMISFVHLMRHLVARDQDELRDLGIKADRESPIETFKRKRDEARRQAGLTRTDREE
ncbi:MAG: hypothetical protein Kow00124_08800 [Anaerolineae bacterium]